MTDSERARLVDDSKPRSKAKGNKATIAATPEPALGDDGFPIQSAADADNIDDISKGVAAALAAHDALTGAHNTSVTGAQQHTHAGSEDADGGDDLEAQQAVRPKLDEKTETLLRRGFLRKIYGILTMQLVVTAIVCAFLSLQVTVRTFVVSHALGLQLLCLFPLLILLLALNVYKSEYPTNILLLAAFTVVEAINLGTLTSIVYETGAGRAILLATLCTGLAFIGLTIFTLQSKVDFSFLGAGLFAGLWVLIIGSLLSMLLGWQAQLPLALVGTAVFSGYVVFDTYRIANRHSYDDYIIAAIDLYLDIINLFVYLLRIILSFMDRK